MRLFGELLVPAARTLVCSLAVSLLPALSGCGSASTCSVKTPRHRIRETERPDLRGVQTIRVVIKSSSSNPNIAKLPFVEVASRLLTWAEITPVGQDTQSADGILEISPDGRPIGAFYGSGPGILVHTSAEVKGTLKLTLRGQSEIASRYFDGQSEVPGITSASRSDEDASIDVYAHAMYAPDGFVTAMFDLLGELFGFHFLWRVSDPDWVRGDYSDAIGKIRQPIAEEALINILTNDRSTANNIAAAGALAQIKSPCAAEALIQAAKRPGWLGNSDRWPRWPLRKFVVEALGGFSGPKVEETLAAVEKDEGEFEDTRKIATESLRRVRAQRQR